MKYVFAIILFIYSQQVLAKGDEHNNIKNIDIYGYIYDDVASQSQETLKEFKAFKNILNIKDAQDRENQAKENFKNLISQWKSTEALYILGNFSDDYIDIPLYIDIFHKGNENIHSQLDFILNSKDNIEDLLYKNSHHSINALEYIIFAKDIKNARTNKVANKIIDALIRHLNDIYQGYKKHKEDFLKDTQNANKMILDALIDSSYKLQEWRVGDVAGMSKKYFNKPNNKRAEYFLSKNSINAIINILHVHQKLIDPAKSPYISNYNAKQDFGKYIGDKGNAKKDIAKVKASLQKALKIAKAIKDDDFRGKNAKSLYKELHKLHILYYVHIMDDLKLDAKILEADGD